MTDRVVKTVKRPERRYKYSLEYWGFSRRWMYLKSTRGRLSAEVMLWIHSQASRGTAFRIVRKGNNDRD